MVKGGSLGGSANSEEWLEDAIEYLRIETDNDSLELTNEENWDNITVYHLEGNDEEYILFENENEAEEFAISRVKEDMQEDLSMFNEDFILQFVKPNFFFYDLIEEMNGSYADDIETENDDVYKNRLISEMVDADILTVEEAFSDDAESLASDKKSDFITHLTSDQANDGKNGYYYFVTNFGKQEANRLVVENNLIDLDEASREAVRTDGVAHFLSTYDGNQIELNNNAVAYRTN